MARLGEARRGRVRPGVARQGREVLFTGLGLVRHGMVGLGLVRHGMVGLGAVRLGPAGQGND